MIIIIIHEIADQAIGVIYNNLRTQKQTLFAHIDANQKLERSTGLSASTLGTSKHGLCDPAAPDNKKSS